MKYHQKNNKQEEDTSFFLINNENIIRGIMLKDEINHTTIYRNINTRCIDRVCKTNI